MSHNLQSAGCQTVMRALPPRRSAASVSEAHPQEIPDSESVRLRDFASPLKRIELPPEKSEAKKSSVPETEHSGLGKKELRPISIGIFGRGRLGTAVLEHCEEKPEFSVAWALGRGYSPRCPVDVALDASRGEAVREHVQWALSTGTDLVVGTSGWVIPDLESLVGNRIGVLVAPNFSLGAALLRRFSLVLGRFASTYPEADLGVCERHHRKKIDAPSGTAKSLASALLEGCPRYTSWAALPNGPDVLSVSSLRTGYEIGYHEVILDAPSETITLTHSARSRDLFARGALEALRWIRGRKGVYSFDDMAAQLIDPLFCLEASPKRPEV